MKTGKNVFWFLFVIGFIFWIGLRPEGVSRAADSCSENVKTPPFLAQGVDPNLLLMIDNSASMFDLAYANQDNYCYDDTYDESNTYAGYFEPTTWYGYDLAEEEFEPKTVWGANNYWTTAGGTGYYRTLTAGVKIDASSNVTAFLAVGNFLNWAAASKLDIQKKILTGGKHDPAHSRLIMESRGCLGRRFVKKLQVTTDGTDTYFMTLGIRPPDEVDKAADPTDDTTRIEIFNVTSTGFDIGPCSDAIEDLNADPPNLGQLYQDTEDCMGYVNSDQQFAARMATFNHSLQNCWYLTKHGVWQPGQGSVSAIMNDCETVFLSANPLDITTADRAYVCYGIFHPSEKRGYVGRCWDTTKAQLKSNGKGWDVTGWPADADEAYACVDQALKEYCGVLEIPEVVDPSDQMSVTGDVTGELWNAPAVLIDSGVMAQLNEPLCILKGHIEQAAVPSGLVQEYANDIRMGAMIFNDDGSASECSQPDPYVLYGCTDPDNRDGGTVISYIGKGASHTTSLVNAINGIKATSWTPIAEAMFNAIGYYTQNSALRLDPLDFLMDEDHPDPCTAWCQDNNILVITEGASTADQNSTVQTFTQTEGQNDDDSADTDGCGTLSGSTLLDDLTYYGKNGSGIFPVEQFSGGTKRKITTHIVVAGTLRATGTNDECSPDILLQNAAQNGGTTLYSANNPAELESKLREALNQIRAGVASGSAASVIASSRGGEGAIYQAIFWTQVPVQGGGEVNWIGEVHATLIDTFGNMYEDTNGNRALDEDDERVVMFYDEDESKSKVCYGTLNPDGTCSGTAKDLDQVHYLWSAAEWLSEITDANIVDNRDTYISNEKERYIFTWNDLDNDGIVDSSETIDFEPRGPAGDWVSNPLTVSGNRGPIPLDFGVQTSAEVDEIVKWVRGLDQAGLRSREVQYDFDRDGMSSNLTWRLGDVIHSTPISVESPTEAYHYLYRDAMYALFADHYKHRRHVIYFGGNDGMLHAVNGGFYNETEKKFRLTPDGTSENSAPDLGAELWAYVPYNLISDLKCLMEPDYQHKFMMDLRPRVFDVQLWDPVDDSDTTHIGGWGTILVAGMRFGGTRVSPGTLDLNSDGSPDYPADTRQFVSAYIIFDVTDPENPPVLLGEMTYSGTTADLGYTTVIPSMVVMKEGDTSNWYLVLGSGPTALSGESDQTGKIAVLPLDRLVGPSPSAFRIPDALPSVGNQGGRFLLDANSFVSDAITVDFNMDPNYKSDAVYFGTVSGTWGSWGGKMYRLVTRKLDSNNDQESTLPSQWAGLLAGSSLTNPLPLIDVGQPVTAPAALGTDGSNFWVYFGTGRFFDREDKSDASQQSYYGIKEPMNCSEEFTWESVEKTGTHNGIPGSQGLVKVDQILVQESSQNATATLSCMDGSTDCLPTVDGSEVGTFQGLINYIAGSGCSESDPTGTDGWYRDFSDERERNLGQGTLLGGLLTFTSYQPYDDVCLPEGLSYLYGVYYQTGTAWREQIFVGDGLDASGNVIHRLSLGRGMATTPSLHVGRQEGSKAFIQTSTGTIVEVPEQNLPLKNAKTGKVSWSDLIE